MTKIDTNNRLNNSKLDDKEEAFGGACFRDIYSGINGSWYRKSRKEFDELKYLEKKYCSSNYYDVSVNIYGVKC